MKILLLNPAYKSNIDNIYEKYYIRAGSRWPHSGVKKKKTVPHYLPFPFSLAYSASLLKKYDFEVYVIDAVALDISEIELLNRIRTINPRLIFYEVITPAFDYDLMLAYKIKQINNPLIVLGGPHVSVFANQIIKDNAAIDFILKGEYEWPLFELSKCVRDKDHNYPQGVVFREGDKIIDRGNPLIIDSLDDLPPPMREIFPSNDICDPAVYWDGFCQRYPAIQMQTSRGCNYNCYFCLWNKTMYNGLKHRTFSAARVVDEMKEVINKYRAKEIYFDDDDFTGSQEHILNVCEEILRQKISVEWSCMGNIMHLTGKILKTMAMSGCIGIKFGVESGSQKILKTIDKRIDLEKIKEIVKYCGKYNIKTQAAFGVGFLNETKTDIHDTFKFVRNLSVDAIQVSIVTPYPGTDFFKIAQEKKMLKSASWEKYDGKTSGNIYPPHINFGWIRKKILMVWFIERVLSPFWLIRHFRIIWRGLNGLGGRVFWGKLNGVIIDEQRNN